MKFVKVLTFACIIVGLNISCSAQSTKEKKSETLVKSVKVEVYYFHNTRRCATCKAVEQVTQESLEELYGGNVQFIAYNLEESEGEQKAELLGVSGQTLLIVNGENQINITNEGFLNARTNPEKLKEIIKEKVDSLL